MLIYFIAGELSGDNIGGKLIRKLKAFYQGSLQFVGIGGNEMLDSGLEKSLFELKKLSVMGFFEIIPRILKLKSLIDLTVKDIITKQPDIVVTIDSPGFCLRVAEKVRMLQPHIKLVHIVAPSIWAYRPKRAEKFAKIYDHLLTLLPFEPPLFQAYGLPTTYIGHFIFEQDFAKINSNFLRSQYNIDDNAKLICLTPGSRLIEIKKHLPIFLSSVNLLKARYKNITTVIPAPNKECYSLIQQELQYFGLRAFIVEHSERLNAYAACDIAIAKSGSNTLEILACNKPLVVAYKVNWLTWLYIKPMLKIKHASLVNIIAGQTILPELIQHNCAAEKIALEVQKLLDNSGLAYEQVTKGQEILRAMGFNSPENKASYKATQILRELLPKEKNM